MEAGNQSKADQEVEEDAFVSFVYDDIQVAFVC
jgi:hypothetical protein